MSLACATVVSLICFYSSAATQHRDWGLGRGDTITTSNYVADAWSGDHFIAPNWRLMPEACNGAVCVRYFKHCAPSDYGFACDYYFGEPQSGNLRNLRVRVRTAGALADAESDIAILLDAESQAAGISLARLKQESEDDAPPQCPRRTDPALCLPEGR